MERGVEVTVLTGIPNYPGGRTFPGYSLFRKRNQTYRGIRIRRVPVIPRGKGGSARLLLNFFSFAITASLFGPFLCRKKDDLILVFQPSPVTVGVPALILKWVKKIPLLFWVQDLWPDTLTATGAVKKTGILKLVEALVRFIYQGSDAILIQSMAFQRSVESFGIPAEKIHYFPNSAEDFYLGKNVFTEYEKQYELPAGFRIVFAGNIGVAQDFKTILAAAHKLRNFEEIKWLILGDGRMRDWVEEQIETLELKETVYLLGRHPAEMMPWFYNQSDALLATLKKDPIFSLTVPSKIQSYLAAGRPIIAGLDGEGARIVKEAGAGLTVPPGNEDGLSNAVMKLFRMCPGEREAMGKRGRTYFEKNFSRDKLLDRLMHVFEGFCPKIP